MKILQGDVWKRRGVSLLWGGEALSVLAQPQQVVSIRQFFAMVGQWPDDLPCNDGNTLVVAGLEGCVDLMDPIEGEAWMKSDLLPAVLAFHDMTTAHAVRWSVYAALSNLGAMLLYGIVLTVAFALAILPWGLGLMLAIPVMIASTYAGYREVFVDEDAGLPAEANGA